MYFVYGKTITLYNIITLYYNNILGLKKSYFSNLCIIPNIIYYCNDKKHP